MYLVLTVLWTTTKRKTRRLLNASVYALRQTEVEPDAMFKVIGEAAAGHRFDGVVKAGQGRIYGLSVPPKSGRKLCKILVAFVVLN